METSRKVSCPNGKIPNRELPEHGNPEKVTNVLLGEWPEQWFPEKRLVLDGGILMLAARSIIKY